MELLEKVEKIREKTGVSYEDAKKALEEAGGDILDAIVLLENQGKIKGPARQTYSTKQEEPCISLQEAAKVYEKTPKESTMRKFIRWCGEMIKKGCENFFIVSKNGEEIITVPVLLLVVLLLFAFWIVVPLLVIGLFFGFRYAFKGAITRAVDVNMACDKAAEAAENVKQEFSRD